MVKCQNCGKETMLPFRCRYCGGIFCEDCRLPPKHNCSGIELWSRRASPSELKRNGKTVPIVIKPSTSYETPKKKSSKFKVLVILLIFFAGAWGYYLGYLPIKASNLPLLNMMQNEITENVIKGVDEAKKTAGQILQKIVKTPSKEEIINDTISSVLEYLNSERSKRGLLPVKLMVGIAQFRADDMINQGYFGHYDPKGYPPFYYYTIKGGIYAMEENCGEYAIIGGSISPTKVPNYAVKSVKDMIYNDALSDWGHRDSLLDPSNNFVDIGVAWNSKRMVLVIHMIKKHVEWIKRPNVRDMVFSASGKFVSNDLKFYEVLVFYHPPPREEFTNKRSYSIGEPIAGIIPGNAYFKGIETWRPLKWSVTGEKFDISFKIKPTKGSGFYTVVIFATYKGQLNHPFDPSRGNYWSVLEYTVFY